MHTTRPAATLTSLLLASLLAAPAAAIAWGGHGIEGSGDLETRTLEVDAFDEIEVGGAFEVEVRFGDAQKLEVTIDDNLWDNFEADVRGKRLRIDWDKSCDPDDDCRIVLTVRELHEMAIHGAADVRIHGFRGERFAFDVSGAAEMEMDGEVDELAIRVSGAGEIDTRDLQAKHVKVRLSGAGNANITATESLDAEVSGVGNIDYWGDPQEKRTQVSGLGNIDAR